MRNTAAVSKRGFTFIEMMVALGLGLLVLGAAVKLFGNGVDATWVVSQRAEMQQDLRATQNMLFKDISMAGAGLPMGSGLALPAGTRPIYGCDQTGTAAGCPPNGGVKYPCSSLVGPCIPTMYGIMPGYQQGIKPPGSPAFSDLITVTYSDTVLALNCYQVSVTSGTQATFTGPPNPVPVGWIPNCVLPTGLTQPQNLNDPTVGLLPGDLILFQGKIGANTAYAVGEVTAVPAGAYPTFTVNFNTLDVLHMNQPGQANDLSTFVVNVPPGNPGSPTISNVANRLMVYTYYLKNIADPTGTTTGVNILYRQLNGQTAVPVADNVAMMQFTYDTYDTSGNLLNQTGDGGESLGVSLNLIRKINIAHLTVHSQMYGTRTNLMSTQGFQGYDIQSSISARNLNYQNRYQVNPGP